MKLSLSDLHSEYGFDARMTKIEQDFPGANIICAKLGAVPEVICSVKFFNPMFSVIIKIVDEYSLHICVNRCLYVYYNYLFYDSI